jgi:hypothetical protein
MTDTTRLRKLAESALKPDHNENPDWYSESYLIGNGNIGFPKNAKFIAAANPAAIIELLDTIDRLTKEAGVKHSYEEAAEFYAECGPGPDQLKSWIIAIKAERDALKAAQPVGELPDWKQLFEEWWDQAKNKYPTYATVFKAGFDAAPPVGEPVAPHFQIALLKELAEVKQDLLATQGQLESANRLMANAVKKVEEWEAAPLVPMTQTQVDAVWATNAHSIYEFARAIEAHHSKGVKPDNAEVSGSSARPPGYRAGTTQGEK